MKTCITSSLLGKTEQGFESTVLTAKEAGFDGFDLGISARFLREDGWERELDRRLELISKAGMEVIYMHMPFDYPQKGDAEGEELFRLAEMTAISLVKHCGAKCAAIHPRTLAKENYDRDEEFKAAYRFLAPYCEHAHREGVKLGIENMRGPGRSAPQRLRRFGTDVMDLISLADALDTGICWDSGHANISMQDQRKSLIKVGRRLTHVHVDDNFGEDDIHIAPFLGNVDWNGFTEGLKAIGYDGAMNIEVDSRALPDDAKPHYAKVLASCAKQLIDMCE